MNHRPVPPLPESPKAGEVFKHYKGDLYKVVSLALHANDEEWMVVYEPMYENSAASLFTRPLREWGAEVDLPAGRQGEEGKKMPRFSKQ